MNDDKQMHQIYGRKQYEWDNIVDTSNEKLITTYVIALL